MLPSTRDDGSNSLENYLRIVDVNFEFLQKLGVEYFCFHDRYALNWSFTCSFVLMQANPRDIAPEGATLEETNKNLDIVVAHIKKRYWKRDLCGVVFV